MYGMYLFKSVKSNKGDTVMVSPLHNITFTLSILVFR